MLTSHSPKQFSHERVVRHAVLNGVSIPERSKAALEARGIDVDALAHRIRFNMGFTK